MDLAVAHPISVRRSLISLNIFVLTKSSSRIHHQLKHIPSRLVPFDKNPGLQPIDVGEVLRVITIMKDDVTKAVGNLQICGGQGAEYKAAVHLVDDTLATYETDAIILTDTENSFNPVNRIVLLHSIEYIPLPIHF